MSMSRSSRMLHYINYRMRITLSDARMIVGTFMAFDRHMNMVLGDSEEFRRVKSKKGQGLTEDKLEKRVLGLIVLRGDSVVSLTIEGPPPADDNEKLTPGGPGTSKVVAGRGLPLGPMAGTPIGLAGPVRGVGGPVLGALQPNFPRPLPPPPMLPGLGMPRGIPGSGMGLPGPPGLMPPRAPMSFPPPH